MARNLVFILLSMIVSLQPASADWNVLKQKRRNGFDLSSSLSSKPSLLKNYCESWRMNVELNNIRKFKVVPEECVSYIKHYMTSSQYQFDSQTAIEQIRIYVCNCSHLLGDGYDGWIFDVDDTLLSTIPYYKEHGFGGEKLNATSMEEWMKKSKAPALKHTLKLFHELKDQGIKIFIVSSRSETLRSATVDNLINVGYHGWSHLILRGVEDECISLQEYKSKARGRLMEQGYRIWGIVGDQWSSIQGLPFPTRTFKLPNSIYYLS